MVKFVFITIKLYNTIDNHTNISLVRVKKIHETTETTTQRVAPIYDRTLIPSDLKL